VRASQKIILAVIKLPARDSFRCPPKEVGMSCFFGEMLEGFMIQRRASPRLAKHYLAAPSMLKERKCI
jgi:hypothetical protein